MKVFNKDIKILGDNEGFIILECPYCKSEFKVSSDEIQNGGDIYFELFCPYCGLTKEIKYFYTKEIKSKSTRVKKDSDKRTQIEEQRIETKGNLHNKEPKLSSSKTLDMSFSNMEKSIEKKIDFYEIKMDDRELQNVNVDRLKDKDLEEILYECDICGLHEKILSCKKTAFYCAYCGVSLI